MTVDVQYTESDYDSAQIAWLKLHPSVLLRSFWYPILILVLLAISAASSGINWKGAAIGLGFGVGLIVIEVLIIRWRWHSSFKKSPAMQQPVTFTVDGVGVTLKGQNFHSTENWPTVKKIRESPAVFLFALANKRFYFLPKRDLNEMQLAEIRDTIAVNAQCPATLQTASAQF